MHYHEQTVNLTGMLMSLCRMANATDLPVGSNELTRRIVEQRAILERLSRELASSLTLFEQTRNELDAMLLTTGKESITGNAI